MNKEKMKGDIMSEIELNVPLTEDSVRSLKLGDVVYLTGTIFTARDEAHLHALEAGRTGKELPVSFEGSAVYHCGPIMKKDDSDTWHVVAAGPTTSSRMNSLEPGFIEQFGVRAIIGKGGMSKPTVEAMKIHGCVYLSFTGGAAILAARGIDAVQTVHWYELGMPEALWVLDCVKFGPVIVGIDANCNSLYEDVDKVVESNIPRIKNNLEI
jgi:fumarate hydratase subunit beta